MTTMAQDSARSGTRTVWPPLLHRIVKTIRTRELFDRGQHLLVAVSGGPDSVALVSLLHRLRASWRLSLTAVHCNYGLRGAESDGDQACVESLCRRLEIPLYARRVDMRGHRGSLQAAARDLRYGIMKDVAEACGADRVAVGHTADDQAETVLLWMLRGAGLTGLSGMPASRNGVIVRPLYETRRKDILDYLRQQGVPFRWDSSNNTPLYLRNRIRQDVMPALQRVMPSAVESLCRLADICGEDDRYLDGMVASLSEGRITRLPHGAWSIDRSVLSTLPRPVQRRVVRNLLRQSDGQHRSPSIRVIDRLLQVVGGKATASDMAVSSWRVTVDRDSVHGAPSNRRHPARGRPWQASPAVLPVPGHVAWDGTGQVIQARQVTQDHCPVAVPDACEIVVDADRISAPLIVRAWKPGDRFCPSGMNGRSKKLQDFFTDLKVSREDKRRIPVVVAPEGIVWIVGYRPDGRWLANKSAERRVALTVQDSCTGKGN